MPNTTVPAAVTGLPAPEALRLHRLRAEADASIERLAALLASLTLKSGAAS
jgi:hypothetical protein